MEERQSPNKGGRFKQHKKAWRIRGQQILMDWLKKHYQPAFESLQYYCFFYGFPRSSHSLVGSLLDAHPEAVIAHEQDAFRYLKQGFNREQLYTLLVRNAQRQARKGRNQTSYQYRVPTSYPGTWETLRVIGDKKGANTCRWFQAYPNLLMRLRQTIDEDIRAVNVIRNPFDNIATMAKRKVKWKVDRVNENVLRSAKQEYTYLSQGALNLEQALSSREALTIYSEKLVEEPRQTLKRLLAFLQLEPDENYLAACEGMIFKKPRKPRWEVQWPHTLITEIEGLIAENPQLSGYDFKR